MHSLKNTIVAVGLLGLSFLFYQASSHKSPVADEMVPALEISDGVDGLEQPSPVEIEPIKSNAGTIQPIEIPKVDMPEFIKPKQLSSDVSEFAKFPAAPNSANEFSDNGFPVTDSSKPLSDPPVARQPIDSVARDEGLIDVLKIQQQISSQNQFVATSPPTNHRFGGEPAKGGEPANMSEPDSQFTSQPIPSSNSSFNAMATDESKKLGSDVTHADSESDLARLNFQAAWPRADKLIAEQKYRDALQLLSRFYRSTDLNGPQRQRLYPFLDGLAGKVIFSFEHHLEDMPYTVANESLVDIGNRWRVPAQLIYNINRKQIPNKAALAAGTQLKIVKGPFNAEIDTKQNVMTLFLGDLYAGRFPIRVGVSGNPKPGDFRVLVKSEVGHSWRDAQGNSYPPGSPENGYGPSWIGLSGSLCIHAVDDTATDGHHGCIGLNPQDAKDVFAILGDGSNVKILR